MGIEINIISKLCPQNQPWGGFVHFGLPFRRVIVGTLEIIATNYLLLAMCSFEPLAFTKIMRFSEMTFSVEISKYFKALNMEFYIQ